MANLSKIKREQLLNEIEKLKTKLDANDFESLNTLNKLKQEITNKKYGLVWEEHSEKVDEMLVDNIPVFTEDKTREIVSDSSLPYNFLLEGDNLHSLKLLEKTHKGKIDIIYIDPPYNAGEEDFIYDDNYVDKNDTFRHSKWMSFMSERLLIANRLLAPHGFIFISIDDNEAATLRILCDEIFGETNYEKTDYIQVRYPEKTLKSDMKYHKEIEQVLVYKKSEVAKPYIKPEEYDYEKFIYSIVELASGTEMKLGGKRVILFKKGEYRIVKHDVGFKNGLKEIWATGTILNGNSSGRFFRDHLCGRKTQDGLGVLYKVFDIGDDQYDYRYFTGPKKANATKGKYYQGVPTNKMEDGSEKITPIPNFYDMAGDFGNIWNEGGVAFNSGKKPIKMIKRFLEYFERKDIWVLDFFAGSGSTGHAVLAKNTEDGGNRKFILCTNNENSICKNVTYPRIKTVITGKRHDGTTYSNGIPANLKYYKTDFIPKNSNQNQSSQNQITLDPTSGVNEITLCDKLQDHIKELIQLETHHNIDDDYYKMILNDADLSNLITNINTNPNLKEIYISSTILLDSNQKQIFESKNIKVSEIPNYYFSNELKENGELW